MSEMSKGIVLVVLAFAALLLGFVTGQSSMCRDAAQTLAWSGHGELVHLIKEIAACR